MTTRCQRVAWLLAVLLAATPSYAAPPPVSASPLVSASPKVPAPPSVVFENAWIRAPLPGQKVTAGYCDIVNRGVEAVSIVGFAGPLRVEMHETTHRDGMARMRALPRLSLAANAKLSLQPGGKHLMLFGLDATLPQMALRAIFANGEEIRVVFEVRSPGGAATP